MGLHEALARLNERVSSFPHNYQPSILSFMQLDVKKVARDLTLEDRGSERGKKNDPPSDSVVFDNVENEVLEFVEGEVKKAHAALLDDLTTYAERLYALDLEGRFSTIAAAAMDGISSFRSEVAIGGNHLSLIARRLLGLEAEMRAFKAKNRLDRTAHYPSSGGAMWRWGVIAVLFLFEAIANGYFLAKGSQYGLVGGFAEALIIAFLNIGASMVFGFFGLHQLWHRAWWRKAVGLVSLGAWSLFAAAFNLFVAHYREAAGAFLDGGGAVALNSLKANPIGLTDFQSWVLFGIGALFAFIALVDALSMDDSYPFYGKLDRALEAARTRYVDELEMRIGALEELKSDTLDAMRTAKDDINKRRGEHGSILESRSRALRAYEQHVAYLERAGNSLLSIYREANRETRNTDEPGRFKEAWTVTRPPVDSGVPSNILTAEKLEAAATNAQSALDERMHEVHAEFEKAIQSYRGVDEISELVSA